MTGSLWDRELLPRNVAWHNQGSIQRGRRRYEVVGSQLQARHALPVKDKHSCLVEHHPGTYHDAPI